MTTFGQLPQLPPGQIHIQRDPLPPRRRRISKGETPVAETVFPVWCKQVSPSAHLDHPTPLAPYTMQPTVASLRPYQPLEEMEGWLPGSVVVGEDGTL